MAAARATHGITRRQGLIALSLAGPVALLAACTGDDAGPSPTGTATGTPDDGTPEDLAGSVAAQEAELVVRYEAAIASLGGASPDLLALLEQIRDQHAAHRDALGGAATTPDPPPQPAAAATILDELTAAERQAARDRVQSCVESGDAELARLLAMIGAAEAAHVPALRDARSRP